MLVLQRQENPKHKEEDGFESYEASFTDLLKQKKSLTSDIRQAGITQNDEDILDTFAETMTSNEPGSTVQHPDYEPKDDEIKKQLSKARQINTEIFKEAHPDEFKKQQDAILNKKLQEEQYRNETASRMAELKEEVQGYINEFIMTAEDMKKNTDQRKKTLE